jgi:8-oxo-dGTP diphosphatase
MDFKISCLLFIRNPDEEILMIRRNKSPNKGFWSPPGGKLNMSAGESPYECAKREAFEETGVTLEDKDLSLFGYVSEKSYEATTNWLMFLFDCKKVIKHVPKDIEEGVFRFYPRQAIEKLQVPPSDHQLVWPFFDQRSEGFWGIRADCRSSNSPNLTIEAFPR